MKKNHSFFGDFFLFLKFVCAFSRICICMKKSCLQQMSFEQNITFSFEYILYIMSYCILNDIQISYLIDNWFYVLMYDTIQ